MNVVLEVQTADGQSRVRLVTQDGRVLYAATLSSKWTGLADGAAFTAPMSATPHAGEVELVELRERARRLDERLARIRALASS